MFRKVPEHQSSPRTATPPVADAWLRNHGGWFPHTRPDVLAGDYIVILTSKAQISSERPAKQVITALPTGGTVTPMIIKPFTSSSKLYGRDLLNTGRLLRPSRMISKIPSNRSRRYPLPFTECSVYW